MLTRESKMIGLMFTQMRQTELFKEVLNQHGQPFPESNNPTNRVTCQKPIQREVEDDENEAKVLTKFQKDRAIGRASDSQA